MEAMMLFLIFLQASDISIRKPRILRFWKILKKRLLPGGHIVIDFLNLEKVIQELIPEQHITKKGIDFVIQKKSV